MKGNTNLWWYVLYVVITTIVVLSTLFVGDKPIIIYPIYILMGCVLCLWFLFILESLVKL